MNRTVRRIPIPTRAGRASLAMACLLGVLAACATNPVTGRSELSLISEEQEVQMGQQGAQQVVQTMGLVDNQGLQQYVQEIGARLAARSERPNLPWTFGVVDDPTPNAFALPGGYIFVTRGLLSLMNSEAELASVIGHEIGHVTAKHSVSQMSRAQLAQLGLGLGAIRVPQVGEAGAQLAGAGLQLLFLKYGRDDERQADDLGFRYALQQNYDVREFDDVFASLLQASKLAGSSPVPNWLATHPGEEERIQAAQQRVAALGAQLPANLVSDRQEYLQRISGLVYGENPRNGFFQGTTFYHPDLRFRLDFPQGWQTQNMTQAVVGVSQQQDAAVQLTTAQGDPVSAARAFLSQQGIRAGQTFQEPINGIPAAGSYFEAQTEQGAIQGIVAYFQHAGQTFQLISYAPAGRFAAYDPVFRRAVASFAPVTDQRILNVQPARVEIVRVDRATTLAQLAQSRNSRVPIEQLVLLNGLSDANAQLPAGSLVKMVAGG